MKARWRSVERSMPEPEVPVIIRASIQTTGVYRGSDLPQGVDEWSQINDTQTIAKVTHWMPIYVKHD